MNKLFVAFSVLFSAAVAATIAWAAGDTSLTFPVGDWTANLVPFFSAGLAALVTYALRLLPANIVAILGNGRVELLLNNAIGYGLNAVAGATKGKTLSVDVGNKVLAESLQYAVDNAPGWLILWAGGPEGLAKKIWGRLDLHPDADSSAVQLVVATSQAS